MTDPRRLTELATQLLQQGGNLESTDVGIALTGGQLQDGVERRILSNSTDNELEKSTARIAAANIVRTAEQALTKVAGGASPANLNDAEIRCLEAIVEVTGRPSTHFRAGAVQRPEPAIGQNEHWCTLIATERSNINRVAASIGCITRKGPGGVVQCVGTGWRIAGELIVTNRHVAAEIVTSAEGASSHWAIDDARQSTIDFELTLEPAREVKSQISELVYCSDDADVDAAVLRVTPLAGKLPAPLDLDWEAASLGVESRNPAGETRLAGTEIYAVGHPYRQFSSDLTASIFGKADGKKRWSPGRVVKLGAGQPFFDHDCSTLGGNSGSCLLNTWDHAVVGLHVGGVDVDHDGKGAANLALALSRLGGHRLEKILRSGAIE